MSDELKQAIQDTIKETVNGKIDRLHTELNEYIKEDMAWKADAQPAIAIMKELTATKKILVGASLTVSAIGGAFFVIQKLIK